MADRWLFAGGGLETLRLAAGAMTSGASFNGTYADHSAAASSTNRYMADFVNASGASDAAATGEKLFVRFTIYPVSVNTAANLFEIVNGSDQPWLALRFIGSSNTLYQLCYNSGTGGSPVWTGLSGLTATLSAGQEVVIWITLGAPHVVGMAVAGSLIGETTFTQASLTSLDAMHLRGPNTNAQNFSELAATVGISLVGSHVFYGKPNGAGSNSGMTGAYTDIDDAGINDADAISSGTAGQRSTFAYSNVPALGANEGLGDVFLYTRARNSGGAPSNVKPVRRTSGGVDNVGSNLAGIAGAYQSLLTRFPGLSEAEFNASEFGVESAA